MIFLVICHKAQFNTQFRLKEIFKLLKFEKT